LQIFFPRNYVDLSDYSQALKTNLGYKTFNMTMGSQMKFTSMIELSLIELYDNTLMPLDSSSHFIANSQSLTLNEIDQEADAVLSIDFMLMQEGRLSMRTRYSYFRLIGDLGGFSFAMFCLGNIFVRGFVQAELVINQIQKSF